MKKSEIKNFINLKVALKLAREDLKMLCGIREKNTIVEIQESKELQAMHRALWISLIVEIGRLFDDSRKPGTISFRKIPHLKKEVDALYGERIIQKIITTRNTFVAHISEHESESERAGVKDICESNLEKILDRMDNLSITQ